MKQGGRREGKGSKKKDKKGEGREEPSIDVSSLASPGLGSMMMWLFSLWTPDPSACPRPWELLDGKYRICSKGCSQAFCSFSLALPKLHGFGSVDPHSPEAQLELQSICLLVWFDLRPQLAVLRDHYWWVWKGHIQHQSLVVARTLQGPYLLCLCFSIEEGKFFVTLVAGPEEMAKPPFNLNFIPDQRVSNTSSQAC